MNVLVTGSSGLIGSEAVRHFCSQGHTVQGIDNNMRREFFGEGGDTTWNRDRLCREYETFQHHDMDIRNREAVLRFFGEHEIDAVIHCAAQPSHDKAREIPLVDFDVNAVGTINLLEATRRHHPDAPFCFLSTNKVYGDGPNRIAMTELETRWEYADEKYRNGIAEDFPIDRCLHSLFGASKVAADIMVQEYGRYYGMKTVAFRGGCLTGPSHSGVELHGFLSYLVKTALLGETYTIYGYKGKQVRDQIHSGDVIRAMDAFLQKPRSGEVYNLGGGRENSVSVLECISKLRELTGKPVPYEYVDRNRIGDHICYITDMGKFRAHYPAWSLQYGLDDILDEMIVREQELQTDA